ncbi:hypothetical protein A2153_01775 [Candidatus Gottesmanbacteria bacterium RBG_16_38_7b]|uniref:Methylated-DNA-[protein]-cysteine S-methyltransferase DNA binding domain-containing protein n=1 Tax=Candidatus Gottesmanbacteria bacterium RBG_16_38_7b TaxID=1798372 RepID=A0A1F5YFU1_9BACT|nr:MAG: hypothetical protein A2153_01775 [Candidatus Gottesmanbacteria bacterium RBG_16_38_7b]
MKIADKVFQIIKKIPRGKVATYKQIADAARIKSPRVVGNILHKNKQPETIPCHRVVRSNGTLAKDYAFGGKQAQKKKLIDEGIKFIDDEIDLNVFRTVI